MGIRPNNTKTYLVTGGAGFIGSEFIRKRCSKKDFKKLFIVDKLTYAANLLRISNELNIENVELIKGDISDTDLYQSALKETDVIVHFAAESHVDRSIKDGTPFIQSNIVGSYSILEAARVNFVEKILMVSTDEVYGSIEIGASDESFILSPSSVYSASKASSDLIALAQFKTFNQNVIITRACNNYGKFQDSEKFIPNVIRRALANESIPIYGDGKNVREWLHVSDHIDAIDLLLAKGKSGEIYNIGSGDRRSNIDVARLILNLLAKSESLITFVEDRKGHDIRYSLDSTKIQVEIGWKAKIDFEDGIKALLNFELGKTNGV
jgi:dTDP-glucose 4,6-dehydratase